MLELKDQSKGYLFGVSVEGDGHVQQQFPLLNPSDKVLDPNL